MRTRVRGNLIIKTSNSVAGANENVLKIKYNSFEISNYDIFHKCPLIQ